MPVLYDYILTAYKVLIGLITTKRLILIALGAFAFYLLWICVALIFGFQRKFSSRCAKLASYIRAREINPETMNVIDKKIQKISNGFFYTWKKFKNADGGKPSDFITRREVLDVEISGGVLNQGKTLMRSFIAFVTGLLFIFNFAYLGSDEQITCFLITEAMVLPFLFYFVMKLFYFLYTSIKQQMYKQNVQNFYELVSVLDGKFSDESAGGNFSKKENIVIQGDAIINEQGEPVEEEPAEQSKQSELDENQENQEPQEEQPQEPANPLDEYDVFKKKNIDVNKLLKGEDKSANTTLPFINVDSDYVVKDDEKPEQINHDETGIYNGVMQDKSSLKKSDTYIDVEKNVAKIDSEKVEELKETEKPSEEDPFSSFEKFEISDTPLPKPEAKAEEEQPQDKSDAKADENKETEQSQDESKEEVDSETTEESNEEASEKQIASVVSGFKSSRSKLANGGVVIERNEPISKRERHVAPPAEESVDPMAEESFDNYESSYDQPKNEVKQLSVDNNNADNVLNSLKTTTGGYDTFQAYPNNVGGYQNNAYGQNYNAYGPAYAPSMNQNPYGYNMQQSGYGVYPNSAYSAQNPYNQQPQNFEQTYEEYDDELEDEDFDDEETIVAPKKKKKVLSKEEEPRPRNLRKKETKPVEIKTPTKTRGRPKKAEVSETMEIKSDKEFDEVLARAEKLMRKSDEGLSQSQSKRIEKELKLLMDAMNRYKESR